MGKSASKKAETALTSSTQQFTDLFKSMLQESKPAREVPQRFYSSIISGGPEAQQAVAPQVEAIREQYRQARKEIGMSLPRGGALEAARANVRIAETADVAQARQGNIWEALSRLASLGTFGTQAGIQAGYGGVTAGRALSELAIGRGQAVASGVGGLAQAFGLFSGLKWGG